MPLQKSKFIDGYWFHVLSQVSPLCVAWIQWLLQWIPYTPCGRLGNSYWQENCVYQVDLPIRHVYIKSPHSVVDLNHDVGQRIMLISLRITNLANQFEYHTPPAKDTSKIFHKGCMDFKWSSPISECRRIVLFGFPTTYKWCNWAYEKFDLAEHKMMEKPCVNAKILWPPLIVWFINYTSTPCNFRISVRIKEQIVTGKARTYFNF